MRLSQSMEELAGELADRGVVQLDDLVPESVLDLMRRGCEALTRKTENMRYSTTGWQLEAEGGGWAARATGKEGIPGKVRVVGHAHDHSPELAAVPELLNLNESVVRPLYGVSGDFYNSYYWAKPSEVGSAKPWHQDALFLSDEFYEKYVDVYTIWIAVDDAREDNGCLRFVPGSHREQVKHQPPEVNPDDLFASPKEPTLDIETLWPGLSPVTIPLRAGSAVVFNGYIAHSSSANRTTDERRAVSYAYSLPRLDGGAAGSAR